MCLFKMCKSAIRVVTNAGAVFVGSILERVGFRDKCESLTVAVAHPENQISCSDIMTTAIGIMCSGNVTYESAREYNNDKDFYQEALGIDRIPSPERLRQRLDQAAFEGGDNLRKQLRDINVSVLKHENVTISALPSGFVPVDCDVTPYNESKSHKEGVSRTYKGFDGYSPMDAHIGVEGYFINTDFREGKQHSQKGTPAFLIDTIDMCNQLTGNPLLFRLDSGNDSVENIGVIMERGHYFIIKRNLRRESKSDWLELAKTYAPIHEQPREGKDIYIGSTWREISYTGMNGETKKTTVRIVFEITERTMDNKGQVLLMPDIDVNTWWDSSGCTDKEVIELYHQHATMEQYHSELKTDMGMEKLPSGKFDTNRLVHELSMIAYNILRLLGDLLAKVESSPIRGKVIRRRIRTVILNVIHAPARIITHARRMQIDLGQSNAWADALLEICSILCK